MKNGKYIDLSQYNKNIKKNKEIKEKKLKNKAKSDNIKVITISSIIFLIIILILTGNVIGKSISDVFINAKAEVATPIFQVKTNPEIDITEVNDIAEYQFEVVNYQNDKITDVGFSYTIEIISNLDEYVEFTLFRNGIELNLENNKTKQISMAKEKLTEHKYTLKIMYDKNKIGSIYEILDNIQIKVHSEQSRKI